MTDLIHITPIFFQIVLIKGWMIVKWVSIKSDLVTILKIKVFENPPKIDHILAIKKG